MRQVKTICNSIVQHFQSTEHMLITRMVLYFKVDAMSRVWLLWASSLRVEDRNSKRRIPLNLSPKFVVPESKTELRQKVHRKKKQKKENTGIECPNCCQIIGLLICLLLIISAGLRYELPLEIVVKYFQKKEKKARPSSAKLFRSLPPYRPRSSSSTRTPTNRSIRSFSTPSEVNGEVRNLDRLVEVLNGVLRDALTHFQQKKENFYFKIPQQLENTLKTHIIPIAKMKIVKEKDDQYYIAHQDIPIEQLQKDFQEFKLAAVEKLVQLRKQKEQSTPHTPPTIQTPSSFTLSSREEIQLIQRQNAQLRQQSARADQVPDVLKRFLPDLTNESYKFLCQEPLFLSRTMELCENCFLKFTEERTPRSPPKFNMEEFLKRNYPVHGQRRAFSAIPRRRSTTPMSGMLRRTTDERIPSRVRSEMAMHSAKSRESLQLSPIQTANMSPMSFN